MRQKIIFLSCFVLIIFGWLISELHNTKKQSEERHNELQQTLTALEQQNERMANAQALQYHVLRSMIDIKDLRIQVATVLSERSNMEPKDIADVSALIVETYKFNSNITPSLVLGLIEQESTFNPNAVSNMGAVGLMQVMPSTALPYLREFKIPQDPAMLFNPVVNTRIGLAYLQDLFTSYDNDVDHAVNAYFWGPGNVNNFITTGETVVADLSYGQGVLSKAQRYLEDGLL